MISALAPSGPIEALGPSLRSVALAPSVPSETLGPSSVIEALTPSLSSEILGPPTSGSCSLKPIRVKIRNLSEYSSIKILYFI